jgi:hypothetical protein
MNDTKKPYQTVHAVTDIFDSTTGRKIDDKWVRIGVMFENRDGTYSILLEAQPLDWARCRLVTRHPKPRQDDVDAAENA